ncbi:MAG: septum formation initiator family protein [Gemmatimonadales bacterium]|nr:septum formation initiator family protein [Gemmatimonadales bacterium]MDZ4259372.1 septum formation initiator family protein [Gemmatimonadales bacterium]MDZ4389194.1 septum formation initiator family protein [Gemmatimonadales bacterium]
MTRGRWLALVVLVLAALFAWQGGIYSTADYRALQAEERELRARLDTMRREVDSMRAFRDSLAGDPAVVERVARERLGMIRDGEIVVTILPEEPDSAAGGR